MQFHLVKMSVLGHNLKEPLSITGTLPESLNRSGNGLQSQVEGRLREPRASNCKNLSHIVIARLLKVFLPSIPEKKPKHNFR